jgi:5,10-methylenetetrahydromethanopterin reductase
MKTLTTLGIAITPSKSPLEYVRITQLCEKMGVQYVWVADEIPSSPYRDPFVTMTTLSLNTKKVKLGTSITNPYSRHPTHIAAALLSIDEISKGRAVIGLGPGGSLTLQPLGIKLWDRPLLAVREAVKVLRRLVNGEIVNYDGPFMKIVRVQMFRKSKIPIYLAARGEGMLSLAGEVADGVLPTSPIKLLLNQVKLIKGSAKKAGRDVSKIDIANTIPLSVSINEYKARESIKPEITYMITNLPKSWLEQLDISENEQETVRKALYRGGIREAQKRIKDKMVDALGIAGTPEICAKKFKEMMNAGATQVVLSSPFGPDLKEAFGLIKDELIPRLR